MSRLRKANGGARARGASNGEARSAGEVPPAQAGAGAATVERLEGAELEADLGSLNGAGAEPSAEGSGAPGLPGLDEAARASAAPQAEPVAAEPLLDGSPEQLLGLIDVGCGFAVELGARGASHPALEALCGLSVEERATLKPMARAAAPRLAALSAGLDAYAHWIFLGTAGWFLVKRYTIAARIARALEEQNEIAKRQAAGAAPAAEPAASSSEPEAPSAPAPGAPIPT